jgi:endonuclease YncB( thermonuclease family)
MSSRGGWFGFVVGLTFLMFSAAWASAMSPRYTMIGHAKVVEVEAPNLLRVQLTGDDRPITIRLLGVGSPRNRHRIKGLSPEVVSHIQKSDVWQQARRYVWSLLDGRGVEIWTRRWDRVDEKNRLLAYVIIPAKSGTPLDVNAEIIKRGMGFVTRDYVHVTFAGYRQLEEEARDNRLGMWSGLPHGRLSSLGR